MSRGIRKTGILAMVVMLAGWVLSFIYGRVGYRIMCKKKDSAGISDI